MAEHARPVEPGADQVVDAILQEAAERAHQRRIAGLLATPAARRPRQARPALQAAFCIDVRSEVFRRALESLDPGIETIGFAGFFGLPMAHRAFGSDIVAAHLPVLLNAGLTSSASGPEAEEADARIRSRAVRAFGRFRQAAVSSFAFVEAAGPFYAGKLVRDALGLAAAPKPDPAPKFDATLTADREGGHRRGGAERDVDDRRPCAARAPARPRRAGRQQPA